MIPKFTITERLCTYPKLYEDLKPPGTAPTIKDKPKIMQKPEEATVLFEVTVNADPEPSAIWTRESGAPLTGDRYKTTTSRAGNDFTYSLLVTVSAQQKSIASCPS